MSIMTVSQDPLTSIQIMKSNEIISNLRKAMTKTERHGNQQ